MTRDVRLYIEDISGAIKEVEDFLKGLSFDDFSKNTQVIRAVMMDLIIIGEAAKHLPAKIRKEYPQIPWSRVVGMRNILTHEYPETDIEVIWRTAKKRLPELKTVIDELLSK